MSNQYNDLLIADVHKATNGEALDVEKNLALFRRLVAGDTSAREEMIAGNMPLAIANVESFIRLFPEIAYLRDDLMSAAFIGLVKAVNNGRWQRSRVKTNRQWIPPDFMGTWINRELGRLIEDENPIRLPASQGLAKPRGEELPRRSSNDVPERFEVPSYERELEMRDLIESCCTCEKERTFVAMREAGHTFAEIAEARDATCRCSSPIDDGQEMEARVTRKLEALRDE